MTPSIALQSPFNRGFERPLDRPSTGIVSASIGGQSHTPIPPRGYAPLSGAGAPSGARPSVLRNLECKMTRTRLPNRRPHESMQLEFAAQEFTLGVGRDDAGAIAEIFVGARKAGSALDSAARDAGILISLALQHGVSLDTMRHASTREADGSPSSIVGAVLDALPEGR